MARSLPQIPFPGLLAVVVACVPLPALCQPDPAGAPGIELRLSLSECIALGLANNLELEVERLDPLHALAGLRGERGAFEPSLEFSLGRTDSVRPRNAENVRATGLDVVQSRDTAWQGSIQGLLPTGTRYGVVAQSDETRSSFTGFQSQFDTRLAATLVQPLLQGFGTGVNLGALRIARKEKEAVDAVFLREVERFIVGVYDAYYELIFRHEDLKANRESLALAERLVADNQQRVDLGRMSSLDVTQARIEAVSRRELVYEGERALAAAQNTLKRLVYRDIAPHLERPVIPEEAGPPLSLPPAVDRARAALFHRCDLRERRARIDQAGIRVSLAKNSLLPTIDLEASYTLLGLGSKFARTIDQMRTTDTREWMVGLRFGIPLGFSRERAERDQAMIEQQRAILNLKRLEQDILVDVSDTYDSVVAHQKRHGAAVEAAGLAREALRAEEEKLRVGTSTTYLVGQLQRDLTIARTRELQTLADWHKALGALALAEGTVLDKAHVVVTPSPPQRPRPGGGRVFSGR